MPPQLEKNHVVPTACSHTHRPTGSLAGALVTLGSRGKDRHPPGRGREKREWRRSRKGRGREDLGWKEPRKKEDMRPGQRHRETSTSKDLVMLGPSDSGMPCVHYQVQG